MLGFGIKVKNDLKKLKIKDQDHLKISPLVIFSPKKVKITSGDLEDQDRDLCPSLTSIQNKKMILQIIKARYITDPDM